MSTRITRLTQYLKESEEEFGKEDIQEFLEAYEPEIKEAWEICTSSMEIEEIEASDYDSWTITWKSKKFHGGLPERISYYLDDFCKELSEALKIDTPVSWSFAYKGPYELNFILSWRSGLDNDIRALILLKKMGKAAI
jgi:hypothetical protein